MDSTHKCKSWAGNIYHHLESICQDVDSFMSKDTVKLVENLQVQSVGTSVKRLYTNMVEDAHPPCKNNDQGPTIVPENKLSENQEPIGSVRKTDESLPIGVETNAIFSRSIDEGHENSMPILHEQGLNTEDHKNNFNRGVLIDSVLYMANDPKSDESRSRPFPTVSKDAAFLMEGQDFVCGVMEKRDKDGLSEIEMSLPSETDDLHLDMETIDLSPDIKRDESSVTLHGNPVYVASRGKRDFKYYKKLIQDALTSRKRLSKEYEHLGILYGDIFESTSSVHTVTSQSSRDMSETEWELV